MAVFRAEEAERRQSIPPNGFQYKHHPICVYVLVYVVPTCKSSYIRRDVYDRFSQEEDEQALLKVLQAQDAASLQEENQQIENSVNDGFKEFIQLQSQVKDRLAFVEVVLARRLECRRRCYIAQ